MRTSAHSEERRTERMHASPMWNASGFRNLHPQLPGLRSLGAERPTLRDFLCGGERRVPSGPLPSVDPREAWSRRPESKLRATWLGHSTVLIEIGGLRVLTDPVWGPRASPSRLIGPKRFQPVPVPLRALREVDLVVISHDHYDHLDYPTIRQLVKSAVPIVTSLGVGAHLERWGVPTERITELDWWETFRLPGTDLAVTAGPAQHFSGRALKDRNATLWSSLVIRCGDRAVFFSGDTGLTTQYGQIAERLGPFDLVMLEVGAFHPAWGDIHLGPENALEAHRLLGGGVFLPVHWGTFNLALHAWDYPAEVLFKLGPRRNVQLLMPRLGEAVEPAREYGLQPWWRGVDSGASETIAPEIEVVAARALEPVGEQMNGLGMGLPWPLD